MEMPKLKKIEQNSSGNCCQTVLPEMSVFKIGGKCKSRKIQMRHY